MPVEKNLQVGASVLETLTTGMYVDPFDALREYIQNAADSIISAATSNILDRTDCGRIEIALDPKTRTIRIRDNGTGISSAEVLDKLLDVGVSQKSMEVSAGFRGIGRLAGLAYCSRLVFATQASNEKLVSTLTFNAKRLRENLIPSKARTVSLQDVLTDICDPESEIAKDCGHFFEVRLENITDGADEFLDWKLIEAYLAQTAPVGLNKSQFGFANRIVQWASSRDLLPTEIVMVLTCNDDDKRIERNVSRSYDRITYQTAVKVPVKLRDVQFFPQDSNETHGYWGWFGVSDCPGVISNESIAGIRIRKNNIAIGPGSVRMDEIFAKSAPSNGRFNKYLIGEIHVTAPEVIPNARRDGFEPTPKWIEIERELIEFARERSKEIRSFSITRNKSVDKILRPVEAAINIAKARAVTGVVDKEEREEIIRRIDKQKENLDDAEEGHRDESEHERLQAARKSLEEAREIIGKAPFRGSKLKTDLDRRQRAIIEDILHILKNTLDADAYEKAEEAIMAKYGIQQETEECVSR